MASTQDSLLSREALITGLPSTSMEEAISFVGNILVERGHVEASYVDGMLEREKTGSTYLGNGVAMPHGTFESRDAVIRTGIVVAQYPDGIDWASGTAHLVIGLGAVGDDHVAILSHIADVLQDEEVAEQLWTTTDMDFLYDTLTNLEDDEDDDEPVDRAITISGEGGLHARPASLIVEYAKSFDGKITIAKDGKVAKATSIMSVLSLGAVANDTVHVSVEEAASADANAAADEIERILTTPEKDL